MTRARARVPLAFPPLLVAASAWAQGQGTPVPSGAFDWASWAATQGPFAVLIVLLGLWFWREGWPRFSRFLDKIENTQQAHSEAIQQVVSDTARETREWATVQSRDFKDTLDKMAARFESQMDKERDGHREEVTEIRTAIVRLTSNKEI